MSPEAVPHLGKARSYLQHARQNAKNGAWEVAAFSAYTAAFHAAQVLVFERGRLTPKTHKGLQHELNRLARLEPAMSPALVAQFARAQTLRHDAVYGYEDLPEQAALDTIAWAERFVADVERVLS